MRKDINHHTQLLNYLIERYGLKSYLEIGLQNPANNFDKINAWLKIGVDPICLNRIGTNEGYSKKHLTNILQ